MSLATGCSRLQGEECSMHAQQTARGGVASSRLCHSPSQWSSAQRSTLCLGRHISSGRSRGRQQICASGERLSLSPVQPAARRYRLYSMICLMTGKRSRCCSMKPASSPLPRRLPCLDPHSPCRPPIPGWNKCPVKCRGRLGRHPSGVAAVDAGAHHSEPQRRGGDGLRRSRSRRHRLLGVPASAMHS